MKIQRIKRDKNNPMGRFGGGWKWAIGMRGDNHTLLVDCLTFSIKITRR